MYVTVTLSMAILSLMCTMSVSGVAKPEQDFGQSNGRMVRVMLVSWVMERVMLESNVGKMGNGGSVEWG